MCLSHDCFRYTDSKIKMKSRRKFLFWISQEEEGESGKNEITLITYNKSLHLNAENLYLIQLCHLRFKYFATTENHSWFFISPNLAPNKKSRQLEGSRKNEQRVKRANMLRSFLRYFMHNQIHFPFCIFICVSLRRYFIKWR